MSINTNILIMISYTLGLIMGLLTNFLDQQRDDMNTNYEVPLEDLVDSIPEFKSDIYPEPIIGLDFDKTIADTDFPDINGFQEGFLEAYSLFRDMGFKIVIWTCREGKPQEEARQFLDDNNIDYDAFNTNDILKQNDFLEQAGFSDSRKIGCDFYVDDKAIEYNGSWEEVVNKIVSQCYGEDDSFA